MTAGQQTKKTIRIPLAGNSQQRDTTSVKDQRFVNYVFETTKNSVTDAKKLFVVKRPGTEEYSNPAAGAAEGRGAWYFNGAVWSVFGSTLYKGTTAKQVLTTSTGMCGAVEFVDAANFSLPGLFIADGTDAWVVDSNDTVTQVDTRYLQWVASTIVEAGDRRVRTTLAHWFKVQTGGRTGTAEPAWVTTTPGVSTTPDGEVTWLYMGTYSGPAKYTTGVKTVGMEVVPDPDDNGYWYECIIAGTASAEPTWPIIVGDTVTDGTVTWECKGQIGGFPSPHIPTPAFMDGYVFLPKSNSLDIYGSDITAPFSWGALNFAGAESYPDPLIALARQNNFITALGTESTEFMYNYAKANQLTEFDTPLDRYESLVIQTGCLNRNALLQSERTLIFIGRSKLGGKAVWRLDGSNAKEISTEYVEKFIDLENSASNITGFSLRIIGHMLFVVNLPTSNKTFVYDLEENMWSEWRYDGGKMPFITAVDADGILLLQHATNGKMYKLNPTVYKDFGTDIECLITLGKQDFDTDSYKFYHQATLIGDTPQHADVLRWSDDDYVTWSSDVTLPVTERPYTMRTGKARRRAWELEYTQNSPRRLEALELTYSIGDH